MKTQRFFILFLLAIPLLNSCSKDDVDQQEDAIESFSSQLFGCDDPSALGYTGAYYDFANARPVAWPEFPVVKNPGEQFIHSQLPLLGFILPQGFTAREITDPNTAAIGVDVFNQGAEVFFRWLPNSFITGQTIPASAILTSQLEGIKDLYEFSGQSFELCGEAREQIIETIPMQFSISLIRIGDRLVQAWVITTYVAGGTAVTISITTAPEADYANQVAETFLPLNYQLYVRDDGNIVDQDGDGFTVLEDPDDTDENVPVNQGG